MRAVRFLLVLTCAVACAGPGLEGARPDGPSAVEAAAGADLRRAQMGAGTDWLRGELVSFCEGGRCTTEPAAPPRFARAPSDGLLVFVVAREPTAAAVTLARRSGARVAERALVPGTSMTFEATPTAGRYVAELTATWDGRAATWVFGVRF